MSNFPIVDTHVHLWAPEYLSYPWLDEIPALNRSFLLPDYRAAYGPLDIEAMVFLECDVHPDDGLKETEWVTGLATDEPRIKGIVACAPLENGDGAKGVLEVLADNPLVKGVRRLIQSESLEFCVQPGFVKGVQILEEFGLSFDLCIYHPQLANTIELVKRCPNVQFILDHIGKPDIENQRFDPWRREIQTLAELPNTFCKISGMVTEASHENWRPADLKPYIEHVIRCFGFDRVMYGSDWPVSTLATEYWRWFDTLNWAVEGCSDAERNKLFRENAIDFYRLM